MSEPPHCPNCGSSMVLRTARKGQNPGSQFWGCPKYFTDDCDGTININPEEQGGLPPENWSSPDVRIGLA